MGPMHSEGIMPRGAALVSLTAHSNTLIPPTLYSIKLKIAQFAATKPSDNRRLMEGGHPLKTSC